MKYKSQDESEESQFFLGFEIVKVNYRSENNYKDCNFL